MSKPILLTCTILTAYYAWNEFLYAIIFIDSDKFRTIPAGLMNLRDAAPDRLGRIAGGHDDFRRAADYPVPADAEAVYPRHDGRLGQGLRERNGGTRQWLEK